MTSCGTPLTAAPMKPLRPWQRTWGPAIDLTGLALLRIATAIWLLADLVPRATAVSLLQSDDGAFPRAALIAESLPGGWTLHLITGAPLLQGALLALAALAHGLLLVGWRTRSAALVSVLLLVSLDNRTPWAALPLDPLLAVLSWCCVLLPVGARLSLDAARRGPGGPPAKIGGVVVLACLGALLASAWLLMSAWPLVVVIGLFVPHAWWRRIPGAWHRPPVTIWIDGECGICTRAGRLLTQIHGGDLTLRTIQEDPEIHALSDAHTSWVVETDGRRHLGWQGVRAVLRRSPWLWVFAVPLPWLGERLYALIAHNRHQPWWNWMGPLPAEEPLPVAVRWAAVALLGVALACEPVARATGLLRQPAADAGLISAPATLSDNTRIDLRTAGPLLVEPAASVPAAYTTFSSCRSQAHLGRLAGHPTAAKAYLDHLGRLAARRGQVVSRSELRQLNQTSDGWRSSLMTTAP